MAIASKNQQNSNSNSNNGDDKHEHNKNKYNNEEVEVANILLELPYLMTKSLSYRRFQYHWGVKKPRSVRNNSTPPSPSPSLLAVGSKSKSKFKREAASASATASPNTPLSFSDFSIKPRHFLRREELEHAVKERLDTQQKLRESIEKVQVYYKSLITQNSELKARKREMQVNMRETEKIGKEEEGLKVMRTCASTSAREEVTTSSTPTPTLNHDDSVSTQHLTPLIHDKPLFCIDLNMSPEELEKAERKRRSEEARRHRLDVHNYKKLTRVRP